MIENVTPRFVTSTLVEATADAVTITWGLGDEIPRSADYFRYSVTYYGADETEALRQAHSANGVVRWFDEGGPHKDGDE